MPKHTDEERAKNARERRAQLRTLLNVGPAVTVGRNVQTKTLLTTLQAEQRAEQAQQKVNEERKKKK